jgi:hypothetical protein
VTPPPTRPGVRTVGSPSRSRGGHRWLLALLLLSTACSGSSVGPGAAARSAAASATPSAPAPSTPEPVFTATPTATPSHAAGRALDGDVDGDGTPDRIDLSGTTLRVALSGSGRVLTAAVDQGLDGSEPAARAGSVDIDRDGHAEVFVRVGQGASTTTLRAFRYDGRALRPLDRTDGPLLLVIGGSVTHGDGFSCTDSGRLVVRSATSDDGKAFTVTTTTYRLAGVTAVQLSRTVVQDTGMSSPAVAAAYRVDCGSVGEGD